MGDESVQVRAAAARNRDTSNAKPAAHQDCKDIVNISVFFDGTGNNKEEDEGPKRWSNPARIWHATQLGSKTGSNNYAQYVSGVGTPFNGTATQWQNYSEIQREDIIGGGVAGAGGSRRMDYGGTLVNDALRQSLINNARKLNVITQEYADKHQKTKISDINTALAHHRLIKMINLSVFGFSRGAALARAFTNELLKKCQADAGGQLTYMGYPLRIHFMGLFDTVASFGVPSLNMDIPFDEKNLVVPDAVLRCVHFVAAHELRFSFPVDLIRRHGKYRAGWTECVYPGVHSDVGGGYEPMTQKISNQYSRIPMRHMMDEAFVAGVKLVSYGEMPGVDGNAYKKLFKVDPTIEAAYKAYTAEVKTSGPVEDVVNAHMAALYSAWGTMTREKITTPDLVQADGSLAHALIGHGGIAREAHALQQNAARAALESGKQLGESLLQVLQVAGKTYSQIVKPQPWRLAAWNRKASPAVKNFIQLAVHDSKAGFLCSAEPFSYFRARGTAESSRNVVADFMDKTATAIKNGAIKIYHTTAGVVVETYEYGEMVAKHTYNVGEKFVVETVRAGEKYAVQVYQDSKQVIITKIAQGEKLIITSVDLAKKKANEMAAAAERKRQELVRSAQDGADRAADRLRELGNDGRQAVDNGLQQIEEGWNAVRERLSIPGS